MVLRTNFEGHEVFLKLQKLPKSALLQKKSCGYNSCLMFVVGSPNKENKSCMKNSFGESQGR